LAQFFCTLQIYQILTDLRNYLIVKIRRKFVIILSLKILLHLKCVATLPCEMLSVLKQIENKTTSVTTGNNVFSVSVIAIIDCHILQLLHQMFSVFTVLPDDAFKPATPLTNGVINETLRQFAPVRDISQGNVATHSRCGGIFSYDIIANFLLILTVKKKSKIG